MRDWITRLILLSPWLAVILFAVSVRAGAATPPAEQPAIPVAAGFDYPVGPPDAQGYYDAQSFGRNRHLGEDWNGNGGGNSDFGDPVHTIGAGVVRSAAWVPGGWGNVVIIRHRYIEDGVERQVESLYAHLSDMAVSEGDVVRRGQQIGAIGDADGIYIAHLHLELRQTVGMPVGSGYSSDTRGYISPSEFISAHR